MNWRCKQLLTKTPSTGVSSADKTTWVFLNGAPLAFTIIAFNWVLTEALLYYEIGPCSFYFMNKDFFCAFQNA